jgi:hypothetical protein
MGGGGGCLLLDPRGLESEAEAQEGEKEESEGWELHRSRGY